NTQSFVYFYSIHPAKAEIGSCSFELVSSALEASSFVSSAAASPSSVSELVSELVAVVEASVFSSTTEESTELV
ncbi:hypothetical protein ACR9F9_04970, partial [Streptococcus dysgalactiae subsp. equisimilis]|uniref:hypothetical protein n=1 Tax=Streptococcus dysgalactiae TaxID=1334 RepID=UPI003FD8F7A5